MAVLHRLLVIDDDGHFLSCVRRTIRSLDVIVMDTAEKALALLHAGMRFDAIACDMHMPGMSGRTFYDRLRSCAPDLLDRIVFMAGGARQPGDHEFMERHPTLLKPFAMQELAAFVRSRTDALRTVAMSESR
jgi:CheY-like chemotaxis protein